MTQIDDVWTTTYIFDWTEPATGEGWSDLIRRLWADPSSRRRITALINDMVARDQVSIPIRVTYIDDIETETVTDGYHRIAAAHALNMPVPIERV